TTTHGQPAQDIPARPRVAKCARAGARSCGHLLWRIGERRSALRVLRGLTGLLETGLLALDGAGVPGEVAGLLERRAVVRRVRRERPGDGQAQRAGLSRGADIVSLLHGGGPSGQAGALQRDDVELLLALDGHQRRLDELLVDLVGEVL